MSLSPQFLDELRTRTSMSQLVGKSLRLRKAGNEWQACCPFHNEKTPSFYINDDKGFAHCFGCGWNGDAMKWLMESRGLEFLDAVRELADAAGLAMPERDPAQRQRDERAAGWHDMTSRAEAWFAQQLGGIAGAEARAYLESRQITADSVRAFGIGFAPDSRGKLRTALAAIGDRALIDVGLLAAPEDGREPYDRFRARLIFPIRDPKGRTISFGGRIIGQGEPKYLNGPETQLFDKGRTLFNLDRAGPAARKAGRIVAVEGYLDVIALAQLGIAETVAPLGTALTEAQLAWLWRCAPVPVLCFDGDAAGIRAGTKAALRALPKLQPGRSLAFAILPAGQDPDDIARAGGRDAIEQHLGAALPLVELLWRHEHGAEPLKTPEARAALRQRLIEHASTIEDADVRREYEAEFRRRVDALFEHVRRKPGQRGKIDPAPAPSTITPGIDPAATIRRKMVIAMIRGCARHPDVALNEVETLCQIGPRDKAMDEAINLIVDAALAGNAIDPVQIDALFPEEAGWRGFAMSFLDPKTWPVRAKADLSHMIRMTIAAQEGVDPGELARMAREYEPPEEPAAGKLV